VPGVYKGMFEQSLIAEAQNRRPWTMALSLTMQASLVGAAILVSIIHIETLGTAALRDRLFVPSLPMRAQPKAVEIVGTVRAGVVRNPALTAPGVFTAPTRIPTSIAKIDDIGEAAPNVIYGERGTPDGVIGSMLTQIPVHFRTTTVPPPPPSAPTQAKPAEAKRINVGGVVMESKFIKRVIPVYPVLAKQARISGTVRLAGIIAKNGTMQQLQVVEGHPLLVNAALDAVRQWIYSPTLLNGEPVEVVTPIEVKFILQ
jgi:protein TonB